MVKQIYYTTNNKIYSNKLTTIKYNTLEQLPKINFDKKNQIQTNEKIILELKKILKNEKEIKIRGIINKPKTQLTKLIQKIEKLNKENKLNSKTPKDEDYDFISATSSKEIIKQIKNQIKDNSKFKILSNQIQIYTKFNHKEFDNKNKIIKLKIQKQTEKIENETLKLKEFQNLKINPIKKNINKITSNLVKLNEDKDLINHEISTKKHQNKYSKKEKLKSQIEVLEDKIDVNNNKIDQLNEHIKILKEKIKLGVVKEINPTLFILTLGLSYYRKSNTLKYKVARLLINISNIKEKNLKIQNILNERIKFYNKLDKEHQDNLLKIKEINNQIEQLEEVLEKEEVKIDKNKPKQKTLIDKIENEENKLEELKIDENENEKTSSSEIEKLIQTIEKLFQKQNEDINKLNSNLELQNIKINKDLIFEL